MVKTQRYISKLFIVIVIMIMSVCTAFAHSGRTDSSGGHRDNNNKSGLGSYHYHCGGYPAHLHSNGYCPYTDTLPSGVDLRINKNTLAIGEEAAIYASVYPSNACNTSVKLESSDSNVVMVYGNSIKAVGYGTATITARSFNDKVSAIKINVKEIQAQSVSLTSESDLTTPIYAGDTIKLSAIIYPDNVDNKSITWKSSDESIATVDTTGNINMLSTGNVTISAIASNGVYGQYTFNVLEVIAEKIEIEKPDRVYIDDEIQMKVKFYPSNTSVKDIKWSVDDEKIATIDENGKLHAIKDKTVTVYAHQKDVNASIKIDIQPHLVESIKIISSLGYNVRVGDESKFSANVKPDNATYKDISWSVSDPNRANIDSNGNFVAKSMGKVDVIATAGDGYHETYTVNIGMSISMIIFILCCFVAILTVTIVIFLKKKKAKIKL